MAINSGVKAYRGLVPSATGAIYTVPSGINRARITAAKLFSSAGSLAVEGYAVDSGDGVGAQNQRFQITTTANESYEIDSWVGISLDTGDTLNIGDGDGTASSLEVTITTYSGDD